MNHVTGRSELFMLYLCICRQLRGGVRFVRFLRITAGPVPADALLWWSGTEEMSVCSEFASLPRGWFCLMSGFCGFLQYLKLNVIYESRN
jgi:hypothetical protein